MAMLNIEMPAETAAALVLACTAIENILYTGKLTEDITDELKHIQPYLTRFMETA